VAGSGLSQPNSINFLFVLAGLTGAARSGVVGAAAEVVLLVGLETAQAINPAQAMMNSRSIRVPP
jgi:hypothetical protein